jgi:hypothetical protein
VKRRKLQLAKNIAIILICVGAFAMIFSSFYLFDNIYSIRHYYTIRHRSDVSMIQSWMTLHYISRSYSVPEQLLLDSINTTSQQAHLQSLNNIAKEHHETAGQVIAIIRSVILKYRAHLIVIPTPFHQSSQIKNNTIK